MCTCMTFEQKLLKCVFSSFFCLEVLFIYLYFLPGGGLPTGGIAQDPDEFVVQLSKGQLRVWD